MNRKFYDGTCYKHFFKDSSYQTLILIHGLGLNQDVWNWQVPLLNNYNILIYDLLGHGDTTKKPDQITLHSFSEQLHSLILNLKIDSSVLIGFSLGSMIARQYSSEHSETVKALILLNSPHRVTENEKNEILNRSLDLKKKGPGSSVEAAIERWFSPQFQKENKHIIDLVKVWININEKDVYSNIYKLLYYGSIGLQDLKDDKPSLILTCDQDFANGPSTCRKIAKNFQNSEVCILRGLRHMALVENYSLVSRKIVSFIDNL